nr:MAG TPA: hypothetical protein [Caudoviricetes sp.]
MAASGMFSAVCRNRWYTCSSQMGAVWHQSKSPPAWWMIYQPFCMTGLRISQPDVQRWISRQRRIDPRKGQPSLHNGQNATTI